MAQELRTPKYRKRVVEDKRRKEVNMNENMDEVDNLIDEVANAELDGLEKEIELLDEVDEETRNEVKEMLDDCSTSQFKQVAKLLIKFRRK